MDAILKIPSVTGIDVELRIAGPGGRSYAFVIDWHIRMLVVLAWMFASAIAYVGVAAAFSAAVNRTYLGLFVVIPAVLLYLLYHPVLEIAMRGRTPGKRIAGVRIVRLDGGVPGIGQLLVRNLFRIVDSLPLLYCVGLASTMLTRQSVRIGDIAAGTLLVYDGDDRGRSLDDQLSSRAVDELGLERADLVRDLISRWEELRLDVRTELARRLLERAGHESSGGDAELRAALEELLR